LSGKALCKRNKSPAAMIGILRRPVQWRKAAV